MTILYAPPTDHEIGGVWGSGVRVNDDAGYAKRMFASVGMDKAGNAYAVWLDYREVEGKVWFAYRPTSAAWSTNEKVSDTAKAVSDNPYSSRPIVAVECGGNAHVVWGGWLENGSPALRECARLEIV